MPGPLLLSFCMYFKICVSCFDVFFYYYYYYFKSSQDKDVQIQTVWNSNYRLLKHVSSFAFRATLLVLLRYILTILRLLRSHTFTRSTLPVWQPILYTVTTAAYIKRKLKSILPHAWVNQFIFKVCQRSNVNLKVSSVTKNQVSSRICIEGGVIKRVKLLKITLLIMYESMFEVYGVLVPVP